MTLILNEPKLITNTTKPGQNGVKSLIIIYSFMNKADLIAFIANKTGLTKKDVASALDAMVEAVISSVQKGQAVTLTNFGTFVSVRRKASTKRNPKTGAPVQVAAKDVPRFRPGKHFRESVAK